MLSMHKKNCNIVNEVSTKQPEQSPDIARQVWGQQSVSFIIFWINLIIIRLHLHFLYRFRPQRGRYGV